MGGIWGCRAWRGTRSPWGPSGRRRRGPGLQVAQDGSELWGCARNRRQGCAGAPWWMCTLCPSPSLRCNTGWVQPSQQRSAPWHQSCTCTHVCTHAPCQAYTYQCTHTHSTHRHAHRLRPRAEPKDSGLQRTRNQPLCPRYLRLVSCDRPVSLCFQVP